MSTGSSHSQGWYPQADAPGHIVAATLRRGDEVHRCKGFQLNLKIREDAKLPHLHESDPTDTITIWDLVLLTFLLQRQFIRSVGSLRLLDGHPISSVSGFNLLVILMLSKTGAAATRALLVSPQAKRGSLAPMRVLIASS